MLTIEHYIRKKPVTKKVTVDQFFEIIMIMEEVERCMKRLPLVAVKNKMYYVQQYACLRRWNKRYVDKAFEPGVKTKTTLRWEHDEAMVFVDVIQVPAVQKIIQASPLASVLMNEIIDALTKQYS